MPDIRRVNCYENPATFQIAFARQYRLLTIQ